MHRLRPFIAIACLVSAGCYHATINTGAAPSTEVIEESFAAGYIGGLVPPKTVEAAQKCTSGVARVETKHTFVNVLVTAITFGIYTPVNIKVTCALPRASALAPTGDVPVVVAERDENGLQRAIQSAAEASFTNGGPVEVHFPRES